VLLRRATARPKLALRQPGVTFKLRLGPVASSAFSASSALYR